MSVRLGETGRYCTSVVYILWWDLQFSRFSTELTELERAAGGGIQYVVSWSQWRRQQG
jgi:hypothetical protein